MINVALYLHAGSELPDDAWTLAPAELLNLTTTEHPGARSAEHVDVAPGGNRVDGFLDLVSPDGAPAAALRKALDELRPLAVQQRRAHIRSGQVCAEFSANLGTPDPGAAFDELAGAALSLYEDPPGRPWLAGELRPIDHAIPQVAVRATLVAQRVLVTAAGRTMLPRGRPRHGAKQFRALRVADAAWRGVQCGAARSAKCNARRDHH